MNSPLRVGIAVAFLGLLTFPSTGWAQVEGPGREMSRQEMLRSLQGQYEARIARELSLDEEQRAVLVIVFREFGEARAALLPRRLEVMRQVNQLLGDTIPEDRALTLLRDLRELREAEASLLIAEEERLLEALSASQVLRLQVLRDQFGDRIRILRAGDSPGAFGPRGGSPPVLRPPAPSPR